MIEKHCNKCNKISEFSPKGKMCRECNKEYQRQHYQKNKDYYRSKSGEHKRKIRKEVDKLKEAGSCSVCKKSYPAPVMDYHHLGDKSLEVSHMISNSMSREKVFAEIDKCVLLCANCHRLTHAGLV